MPEDSEDLQFEIDEESQKPHKKKVDDTGTAYIRYIIEIAGTMIILYY